MRRLALLACVRGMIGGTVVPAVAATRVDNNCSTSWYTRSIWRRADAYSYARVALGEGYEWGGGCWNNNDDDDTPGAPDSGGEGPDCSGLIFKTWALDNEPDATTLAFRYRYRSYKYHGPYGTYSFSGRDPDPKFYNLSKSSRTYMDAFVWNEKVCTNDYGQLVYCGHIGLFVSNQSNGTIKVLEAKGDADGVLYSFVTWHTDTNRDWKLVRRNGWSPSCAPGCS